MSWDASVYLAKKRVTKKTMLETYETMKARFGGPREQDDEDDDRDEVDDEDDTFHFARFVIRVTRDGRAGLYLSVSNEDVDGDRGAREAHDCMDEWAVLLGGAISEEAWFERIEAAASDARAKQRLPKFGPADTVCYLAFDAEGNERGKKLVGRALDGVAKPRMLEPASLKEHGVVRVERISFGAEGTVGSRESYEVRRNGTLRLVDRD